MKVRPAPKQPFDRWLVGVKLHEVEPPPQREIHKRDGAVRRVHRADDEQVLRQSERLVGIEQAQLGVAVLQEKVEFAEHFGQIPAA